MNSDHHDGIRRHHYYHFRRLEIMRTGTFLVLFVITGIHILSESMYFRKLSLQLTPPTTNEKNTIQQHQQVHVSAGLLGQIAMEEEGNGNENVDDDEEDDDEVDDGDEINIDIDVDLDDDDDIDVDEELKQRKRLRTPRNETAAMCVIVKDAEMYVEEWIDYHINALGFDMIYLFVNEDYFYLKKWARDRKQYLKVIHHPGEYEQFGAYERCAKHIATKTNYTYAGFYDIDEFLVLKKHNHVVDMLQETLPSGGSLALNWVFVSQNDTDEYHFQPLLKRCQYRQSITNIHVKTIAKVSDIETNNNFYFEHPHYVVLKSGKYQQDTNGNIFGGPFNPDGPDDVAVLFHYRFVSRKEYIQSRSRGRADLFKDDEANTMIADTAKLGIYSLNDGTVMDPDELLEVYDDSAWKFLTKYVPKYKIFDTW